MRELNDICEVDSQDEEYIRDNPRNKLSATAYECVMVPSEKQNPHRIPNILKCLSSLFIFLWNSLQEILWR
jgi:hypothetical protein